MFGNNFKALIDHTDFFDVGIPLFESDDVTNSLISIYLDLMADGWVGYPGSVLPLDAIGAFYQHGLWLSCVPRLTISGQVDLRNDGVASIAAMPLRGKDGFNFVSVQELDKFPRGIAAIPGATKKFWIGVTRGQPASDLRMHGRVGLGARPLLIDSAHFCLVGDRILPARHDYGWPNGAPAGEFAIKACGALQTVADMRSMWMVETKEKPIGQHDMPIRLGVDPEIIKSLFYARQAPISESGRRRPILHWVRSHMRRLREGIDIDISKHLRGITEFEMDGFPFQISQPQKKVAKR